MDIFPSLVDLAGLPVPKDLMGATWVPLLRPAHHPAGVANGRVLIPGGKNQVFSQYPRYSDANKTNVMGYSMRTKEYRYTEWIEFECSVAHPMHTCPTAAQARPHWGEGVSRTIGVELYDHRNDTSTTFGDFENVNLAYLPEHQELVYELRKQLRDRWPTLQE